MHIHCNFNLVKLKKKTPAVTWLGSLYLIRVLIITFLSRGFIKILREMYKEAGKICFDSDLCQSQHAGKIMFPASQFAQCQARETPA